MVQERSTAMRFGSASSADSICLWKAAISIKTAIGTVDDWGYGFVVCGGITARWKFLGIDARVKYSSVIVKPLEDKVDLGSLTLSAGAGFVF
jgi:hypothetical protein